MIRAILRINVTGDKELIKRYIFYSENGDNIKLIDFKNDTRSLWCCRKFSPETKNIFVLDEMITPKMLPKIQLKIAHLANRMKTHPRTTPTFYVFVQEGSMKQEEIENFIIELKRYMILDTVIIGMNQ